MVTIENIKMTKIGNSWGIIIPSDFFKHSKLNKDNTYNVSFKEVLQNE
ncbi:hypothetical protein K8R33_02865 [archaeon]|nr:hypothetical protein [archaeon]